MKAIYSKSGKIVFNICINRHGKVVDINVNEFESTQKDPDILRTAMRSLIKYEYEKDFTAAKVQCGKFAISIDTYNGIRG